MAEFEDICLTHVRRSVLRHDWRRFIRHDWERFLTPDWETRMTPGSSVAADMYHQLKAEQRRQRQAHPEATPEEIAADKAAYEEYQAELAELRGMVADLKLDLLRREFARKAFNPSQPRVPAGNSDGGQWASGGGVEGRNDPRIISDATPDGVKPGARYAQNDPRKDRLLNRHIIDNHVGKTDEELKARIRREQLPGLFVTTGRDRNGSFDSVESARDLISRTTDNNPETVARVVSGQSREELLTWRFGYETGREAYLDPQSGEIRIRTTYNVGVAIAHDPSSGLGYRVISAYPRNFNPRIGR